LRAPSNPPKNRKTSHQGTEGDTHRTSLRKGGLGYLQPSSHEHFLNKNQIPLPTTDEGQQEPIFSCQSSIMDYVTLEGIENRTGIEKENAYAFVLKELLDNAKDFLETQHRNSGVTSRRKKIVIPVTAEVRLPS